MPRSRVPLASIAAIEIEAEIDAQRSERRSVAEPEARRGAQVAEAHVARTAEDVASIDEPNAAQSLPIRRAQLEH